MRQLATALAVAAAGVLVAACGGSDQGSPASTSTTSTTPTRPPLGQAALDAILLTPAEADAAMGTTGMAIKEKIDALPDNSNKQWPQGWKWPADCLFAYGAGEAQVYAGSGFTAVRGNNDTATGTVPSGEMDPELDQAVVLFPSAKEANAFFTTSSQRWPACANRQFTTPGDADSPEAVWQVGALSTANDSLSLPITMTMTKGSTTLKAGCQRVLTVRNNVAIDLSVCGKDPGDVGVKIAKQIADKVDKQ